MNFLITFAIVWWLVLVVVVVVFPGTSYKAKLPVLWVSIAIVAVVSVIFQVPILENLAAATLGWVCALAATRVFIRL